MVTIDAVLKCSIVSVSVAMIALAGCLEEKTSSSYTCQIDAGNQSTNDIRFVVVISEDTTNEFGFLDAEVGHATSLFCRFRLSSGTSVTWEENEKQRSETIDTAKYTSQQTIVKSLSFVYLGNGKWRVIARSGTDENSPEVKP